MANKPSYRDGYSINDLDLAVSTCLSVFTFLGDYSDQVVVVGGLSPYLLVKQDELPMGMAPHVGTMDLDLGLSLAVFDQASYQGLTERLRDAGLRPEPNDKGNARLQTWALSGGASAKVDFLVAPSPEGGPAGRICHIEGDFGAFIIEGLDLAFRDRQWVRLEGFTLSQEYTAWDVPVCGPGAFTVLKALAFRGRGARKDAYDLNYVWSGLGVDVVSECLLPLSADPIVDKALGIIRDYFTRHDGLGPIRAAEFLHQTRDDAVQADVVGNAREILRLIEVEASRNGNVH